MRISEYRYGLDVKGQRGAAVCLGFFDGVHEGHRALIAECVSCAKENGLIPTVFTFPSESMSLKGGAPRIYSTKDKLRLFESLGIEHTVLADFESVAALTPEEFADDVIIRDIGAKAALSGYSFRFGKGASGDSELLSDMLSKRNIEYVRVSDISIGGETVSSTRIREALTSGDLPTATLLLGEPYSLLGTVVHGDGRGHTFGYPTVNTELSDSGLLPLGVYKTEAVIRGEVYTALTNVGVCPTFGIRERHAETLILDFSKDIYGDEVRIRFLEFLRGEKRFGSKDELIETIKKDIKRIKNGSMD